MTSVVPSTAMRGILETAVQQYEQQLPGSPGESALLTRGLSLETIRAFLLGFVRDPLMGHDDYKNYLAIPYLTRAGPVGMRFKRIATHGPKVLAILGSQVLPYNVASLVNSRVPLFLCEGEPDTWAATEAGMNALGIPGVSSYDPLWRRLLRHHPDIRILQQGDTKIPEGMKVTPAVALTKSVISSGVYLKAIRFPDGMDVNDMLLRDGAARLREFCGMG